MKCSLLSGAMQIMTTKIRIHQYVIFTELQKFDIADIVLQFLRWGAVW